MHNAESILVIIVSTVLTLFLVAGIILLVLIARLVSAVRQVVEKAEHFVESAEEAADVLRNASGPLAFFKLVRNMVRSFERKGK